MSPKQEAGGAGWIHMAKTDSPWLKTWKDPGGEKAAKEERQNCPTAVFSMKIRRE